MAAVMYERVARNRIAARLESDEKEALDLLRNPHFVSIGTTQMNTRINRMDWASVESPTERNIHPHPVDGT
jgi:hypothetical protein